jgi:hypothetical protein
MTSNSTIPCLAQSEIETAKHLFDNWFDPIEAGLRDRVREFLHAMLEGELDMVLSRPRYGRSKPSSGDSEARSAPAPQTYLPSSLDPDRPRSRSQQNHAEAIAAGRVAQRCRLSFWSDCGTVGKFTVWLEFSLSFGKS